MFFLTGFPVSWHKLVTQMSPRPSDEVEFGRPELTARVAILLGLCSLGLAGCSGGSVKNVPDGAADVTPPMEGGTTGDANAIVGTFVVSLVEETATGTAAHTTINGSVKDHADPVTVPLVPVAKGGDCTLSTPHLPFCATPCGEAACVADNTCASYGTSQDVGVVTLTGVAKQSGDPPLRLTSVQNAYQAAADQAPAYPPFAEGDDVALQAAGGGVFAPFSIHATAIAPLALTSDALTLDKTKDFTVTWTAAGSNAKSTIHFLLDLSHHGGLKGEIDCDTADAGSLTISAALLTQLLNLGVAGYPSFKLIRKSVASTAITPGLVQLELSQSIVRYVQIPGLVSCTDDTDCPTGQTCQGDQQCK